MWLRLKIFIGYLVLIVLLAFTIFLLRDEQLKRNRLQTDEAELLHARNLAEQAYAGLLELATRAETVSVWGEEDLAGYRDKRTEVCRTLQELGPHIRSSSGQARMDDEKEYLTRGFAGCIRKPFTMESLAEGVARVTGKKENGDWKPDFSLILTGEDNRWEMLEVFITESRKDLSRLHEALKKENCQAVLDILHKNLPLWDAVRLDFPIEELRRIITIPPRLMDSGKPCPNT